MSAPRPPLAVGNLSFLDLQKRQVSTRVCPATARPSSTVFGQSPTAQNRAAPHGGERPRPARGGASSSVACFCAAGLRRALRRYLRVPATPETRESPKPFDSWATQPASSVSFTTLAIA